MADYTNEELEIIKNHKPQKESDYNADELEFIKNSKKSNPFDITQNLTRGMSEPTNVPHRLQGLLAGTLENLRGVDLYKNKIQSALGIGNEDAANQKTHSQYNDLINKVFSKEAQHSPSGQQGFKEGQVLSTLLLPGGPEIKSAEKFTQMLPAIAKNFGINLGINEALAPAFQPDKKLSDAYIEGIPLSALGALIPGAAATGKRAIGSLRSKGGTATEEEVNRNLEAAKTIGIDLPLAQATASPLVSGTQSSLLANTPFSGMSQHFVNTGKTLKNKSNDIVNDLVGNSTMKDVMTNAMKNYEEAKTQSTQNYKAVDNRIKELGENKLLDQNYEKLKRFEKENTIEPNKDNENGFIVHSSNQEKPEESKSQFNYYISPKSNIKKIELNDSEFNKIKNMNEEELNTYLYKNHDIIPTKGGKTDGIKIVNKEEPSLSTYLIKNPDKIISEEEARPKITNRSNLTNTAKYFLKRPEGIKDNADLMKDLEEASRGEPIDFSVSGPTKSKYFNKQRIAGRAGDNASESIYRALGAAHAADINNAVKEINDPQLDQLLNKANSHYKEWLAPVKTKENVALRKFVKGNGRPGQLINSFSKTGWDDPDLQEQILKFLDPKSQRNYTGHLLSKFKRTGFKGEEKLKEDRMLGHYEGLGDKTKEKLFQHAPEEKQTLDAINHMKSLYNLDLKQLINAKSGEKSAKSLALYLTALAGLGGAGYATTHSTPESLLISLIGLPLLARGTSAYLRSPMATRGYLKALKTKNSPTRLRNLSGLQALQNNQENQ
jgi:hypothetical protein